MHMIERGWAIIQPEGPHWVFDVERADQVGRETNPPNEVRRLAKNRARCTIDREDL